MLSCHRDPATRIQKAMERGDREFNEGKYPEAIIYYGQALQVDAHYAPAPANIPGDSFVFAIRTLEQSRRTRW